ncbi:hypothetical protein NDU88_007188 [Pleurodeles waltl]|uniref:Uncharacterized protein n=1 Tax=Pleurodeles waltl TaxID=8319 RepID=A0AAV7UN49_PLEWA|nr:hypothetical protein NDU88_007188 [Pleurodeles waltl]
MSVGGGKAREAERARGGWLCSRRLLVGFIVYDWKENKERYTLTQLPRFFYSCHYKWRRGSQFLIWPTSVAQRA